MTLDPNNLEQNPPSSPPEPSPTTPQNQPPAGTNNAPPAEFFTVLAEKDREIAELRRSAQAAPAPVVNNHEDENKLFYENPSLFFEQKIKRAVSDQVAPLNQYVAQNRKDEIINNTLLQLKLNPVYAHYVNQPAYVAAVRAALANVANVDQNTVVAIANSVIGFAATGQLQGVTLHNAQPAPAPTPTPAPSTPPYIPPASPSMPNSNNEPQKRQLTEAERRLARAAGLTDEQYIAGLEGSSRAFVNTRPQPKA